jgi:hypothetical protein
MARMPTRMCAAITILATVTFSAGCSARPGARPSPNPSTPQPTEVTLIVRFPTPPLNGNGGRAGPDAYAANAHAQSCEAWGLGAQFPNSPSETEIHLRLRTEQLSAAEYAVQRLGQAVTYATTSVAQFAVPPPASPVGTVVEKFVC